MDVLLIIGYQSQRNRILESTELHANVTDKGLSFKKLLFHHIYLHQLRFFIAPSKGNSPIR
jgi:hypothetical protein